VQKKSLRRNGAGTVRLYATGDRCGAWTGIERRTGKGQDSIPTKRNDFGTKTFDKTCIIYYIELSFARGLKPREKQEAFSKKPHQANPREMQMQNALGTVNKCSQIRDSELLIKQRSEAVFPWIAG